MWHTEPAPASLTLFGVPNEKLMRTDYAIGVPYLLGIIATRSFNEPIAGITELIEQGKQKIRVGILAYDALVKLKQNQDDVGAQLAFAKYQNFLGYGLLLKKYTENVTDATEVQINQAAHDLKPKVAPLFFAFHIMVACGLFLIVLFMFGNYLLIKRKIHITRWYLYLALVALPLPWIAAELGWIVAEYGRQPWVVQGILPTFMATSTVTMMQVLTSLLSFVIFYSVLAVIEIYLMVKYIRIGPEGVLGQV